MARKLYPSSLKMQILFPQIRAVEIDKVKFSNLVTTTHSPPIGKMQQFSTHRLANQNQDNLEKITKLHLRFDHKRWWQTHGDVVRNLLEGGNNYKVSGNSADHSWKVPLSKDCFEQTYATDAIYQDLFIDCPPCRDTLKLSFHLINKYWEIKVIEWNPPSLMTTSSSCKKGHDDKKSSEGSLNHHQLHHCGEGKAVEAKGTTSSSNNALCLQVPYTAKQQPRLSFLPSILRKKLMFLEFEYEGWVDLYLRPISSSKTISSDERIIWKVYRHDDRFRVDPLSLFIRYNHGIKKLMKVGNAIDALTIIEQTTFISNIFQWFRWAHGVTVHHFAKKEN